MARRLADGRREELLDGVLRIIAARGFYDTSTSDIARELRCSVSTLYKIAPSKDGLVLLAFSRWADVTFARLEVIAGEADSASGRARAYFRAGAESVHPFSVAFFADLLRFESIGLAWRTMIADRYIDRFVDLVGDAVEAGEVRPVNSRFLGEVLRQLGVAARDETTLTASGLTGEEAVLVIDSILWDGLRVRQARDGETA
jgi:AcrR family transcriptional regulator